MARYSVEMEIVTDGSDRQYHDFDNVDQAVDAIAECADDYNGFASIYDNEEDELIYWKQEHCWEPELNNELALRQNEFDTFFGNVHRYLVEHAQA